MNCQDANSDIVFDGADFAVVGVCFSLIVGVGLFQACKLNHQAELLSGHKYVQLYFLANRSVPWFLVGAALFSTDMGAGPMIGMFGAGGSDGLVVAAHQWWGGSLILIPMAYIFIPVYINANMQTTAEYIGHRYNSVCRIYVAVLTILLYISRHIPAELYAGAIFLEDIVGFNNLYISIIVLFVITALFCIIGGLKAVIYTELIQCFFILSAGVIVLSYAVNEKSYQQTKSELPHFFQMYKPTKLDEDFPGVMVIFLPLTMSFYWIGDQAIVQRAISAKNTSHAKTGIIMCAILKILPVFLFVIPAIIVRSICEEVFEPGKPGKEFAFGYLVKSMRHGLIGLVGVGVLSAFMSSVASYFNATSALLAFDIFQNLRPQTSPYHLVLAGRIVSGIMMVIGIAWVPLLELSQELYSSLQAFFSYFIPPLSAVFILGVLWRRANQYGAMLALGITFCVGGTRAILNFVYLNAEEPTWFGSISYIVFGFALFWLAVILVVIGSLLTPPPNPQKILSYTFWDSIPVHVVDDIHSTKDSDRSVNVHRASGDYQLLIQYGTSKNLRDKITNVLAISVVVGMVALWIIYG